MITDYVSAEVLEREGYIHIEDKEKLFQALDRGFLGEKGWINLEHLRHIRLSVSKASEIAGCSRTTLETYIGLGYVPSEDGSVTLLDAIKFDYPKAKQDRISKNYKFDNAH